jgi:hypothetical protein
MFEFINNLLGSAPKERRTQLFFRDDGKFQFRKLEIEHGAQVEKQNDEIIKAWPHFYGLQKVFNGFKGIGADMVTIAFDRDIILDIYDQLSPDEKPEKGHQLIKSWISRIGEGQRYKVQNKPGSMLLWDKITMFLGTALVLEWVVIGVNIAINH